VKSAKKEITCPQGGEPLHLLNEKCTKNKDRLNEKSVPPYRTNPV